MKTASVTLQNALKQGVTLKAQPQLIAEWNQNRYAPILEVKNVVDSTAAALVQDCFPINSIAEPLRPESAGIVKAWTTSGARTRSPFGTPSSSTYRSYVADPDSNYKYWVSDNKGNGSGVITSVTPRVVYSADAWVNKISVCFERNVSYPTAYTIDVTTDGTSWATVATNVAVPTSGRVEIYRQAGGTWSTTVYRDNPVKIRGVRVNITTLNKPNERAAVIEISPRLESDLTQYLARVDDTFTMSDVSLITPLGVASSNTGSVTLSNTDGIFNNENSSSIYYKLIDKNVKMTMNIIYDLTDYGGSTEVIREFTMFTDGWGGDDESSITAQLKDASKFLQEIKPNAVYWPDMTVPAIVATICDSIGFTSWSYDDFNSQTADQVPHFWTDGEQTAWNIFNDIAEPTQTALFFDEYGVLRIRTRQAAYDNSASTAWALSAVNSGPDLANIIEAEKTNDFEANSVRVKYLGTRISDSNNGYPAMEVVWQPSDTVVLRSSNLVTALTTTSTSIKINQTESQYWDYSGFVQINGEIIEYDAKGYFYTTPGGAVTHTWITSEEDKKRVDTTLSSTNLAFSNKTSGHLRIKNRGVWGTTNTTHTITSPTYTKQIDKVNAGGISTWNGGTTINPETSWAQVRTNTTFSPATRYLNKINVGGTGVYRYFGTRVKFLDSGYTFGCAGIAFNLGTGNTGYCVDLTRTAGIIPAYRNNTNEVSFYVNPTSGTYKRYGPENGKGATAAIVPGIWYDLDVKFTIEADTSHTIDVFLNGDLQFSVNLTSNKQAPTTTIGFYTRGNTYADFEYMYALGNVSEDVNFDGSTYYDYIRGGFGSGRWSNVIGYNKVGNPYTIKNGVVNYNSSASKFFDDFGPIVHEIRQFDVKFEKYPNVHSNLYFSNTGQAACLAYNSTPFGASFLMANTSRENAVLNGEDTLTFGADNSIDQKMMVYGRLVAQDDEQEVVVKSDAGIRARGLVETEISSNFIQSKDQATSIGNWINTHWSTGNDELTVRIFGNPLIEIGDIVTVNYPSRSMTAATHKYFVVEISNSFEQGLSTSLVLRRVKV